MKMLNILKNTYGFFGLLLAIPILGIFAIIALLAILITLGIISLTMGFGVVLGLIIMVIGVAMAFANLVKIGVAFIVAGIIIIFSTAYGIIDLSVIGVGAIANMNSWIWRI